MKRFHFSHIPWRQVIAGMSVLALLGLCIVLFYRYSTPQPTEERLQAAASEVLAECSSAPYRPTCYDQVIPTLMGQFSMVDTFNITRIIQDEDPSYQYCHVLGHELAANEVKKDPSKWEEVAASCPTDMCSNGCIHGAFQERFRTDTVTPGEAEKLEPQFSTLCESRPGFDPSGLTQASCYHAVGHLLMYVTNADISTSLNLCGKIAVKSDGRDYSQVCYDGVFMQIFQPLEPADFALVQNIAPTSSAQVPGFCNKYSGLERGSCISESWPLFRTQVYTPSGAVAFCSLERQSEQQRCFDATFYVVTAMFNLDPTKMGAYCSALPQSLRDQCFSDAAGRMVEVDSRNVTKAAQFCAGAAAAGAANACYGELAEHSSFDFLPNSPDFQALCNALPDQWKSDCFSQAQNNPS